MTEELKPRDMAFTRKDMTKYLLDFEIQMLLALSAKIKHAKLHERENNPQHCNGE